MSRLPPTLLQRLARSRLGVRRATSSVGIGERRSRAKGSGIEFADHRPYQHGDDVRYLDRHLYERLGEHFVKEFSPYKQLPVTLLLDASASMAHGRPSKFDFAAQVVAALGYVALAGSDQVRVGAFAGGRVRWSERFHGARRAPLLFDWLERQQPGGATDLPAVMRAVAPVLRGEGLTIVVSDWLTEGIDAALKALRLARQELVAVQVLAPEELEPDRLGSGQVRFVDAESGIEVEIGLDEPTRARYRRELERWTQDLKDQVAALGGRFLQAASDADIGQLMLRDWRTAGLVT